MRDSEKLRAIKHVGGWLWSETFVYGLLARIVCKENRWMWHASWGLKCTEGLDGQLPRQTCK